MSQRASGAFRTTVRAEPPYDAAPGAALARTSIDKEFEGDLVATSRVEMLSAMTEVQGSAGYVAIERVTGSLHGRAGSFVLQHSGTMTRGEAELAVSVVPDSGTGELRGLSGSMTIAIVDGKHHFELHYDLEPGAS